MNKRFINGVIIVEGKHDVAHLSNLYDFCYIITNGYDIPQKEINFLLALPINTNIIVLTDSDEAGDKIRNKINDIRKGLINIKITAPITSKKKGIAECELKDLEKELDQYCIPNNHYEEIDLYKLGLSGTKESNKLMKYLVDKFNLGITNKTNIIKRMNILNITEEDLSKEINNAKSK